MSQTRTKNWKDITPEEVQKLMKEKKEIELIDVREVDEYVSGHIEGTKLIPFSQLDVRFDEIDPNKETIMICRSGNRSAKACDFLVERGHTKLKNMVGGMLNWQGEVKSKE